MASVFALLALIVSAQATPQARRGFQAKAALSKWVYPGPDQRLRYATDARGNRIMDFSFAGYKGGGVALPVVRVERTVAPVPGDNTTRIQAAIDEVSKLPLDRDGFRGAVLLAAGTYEVAGELKINASGVVLRGSGSGEGGLGAPGEAGTKLRVTGAPHRFIDISGSGAWQAEGTPAIITDRYVPSGATTFTVDSAAGFKAGDSVLVQRPVTAAWIRFMGMDTLVRDGKPQTWIKPGSLINTDRVITAIDGTRLTLDVPLSDSFDAAYLNPPGTSVVKYTFARAYHQRRRRIAARRSAGAG